MLEEEEQTAAHLGLSCHLPISNAPHLWDSRGSGSEDSWGEEKASETQALAPKTSPPVLGPKAMLETNRLSQQPEQTSPFTSFPVFLAALNNAT